MRVLLQGRDRSASRRGGDSTVADRLARELESLGHDVVIASRPPDGGLGRFDVVHAINLDRSVLTETETLARAARAAGARLVVTPLWWPLDRYVRGMPRMQALAFRAKGLGPVRALRDRRRESLRSVRRRQAAVLAASDAVCPTGRSEAFALEDAFGPLRTAVVALATHRRPSAERRPRCGVLCVGRLDPRKNQLALITALRGSGIPLRLIGTGEVFPAYAARCREAAGAGVELSGFVSEAELDEAYRSARVHALPSWFELPGLVSLDAAASGAAVVVSRAGTAGEYLGRGAAYCSTDPVSVRSAVMDAYEAGPPEGLAARVASTYTWRATAECYLEAYHAS
ncbi:MAG TPA: glycosyltransferase [Actinomycetota bacterium]|nr:glycosyltransferase [Actinomycetota bacterium]